MSRRLGWNGLMPDSGGLYSTGGGRLRMLVAVLSLCNGVSQAAQAQLPVKRALSGKLVFKDAHVREIWTLVDTNDDVYKLPGQPRDSQDKLIFGGASVSLDCVLSTGDDKVCTNISNVWVTKAAAPVKSTDVKIRLLVMVTSLTGSCSREGAEVSAVQRAYLEAGGYVDFMRSCSYGKMVYDKATVTVISTPVKCTSRILACDEDALAEEALAAANPKVQLADFTHFSYVLPVGMRSTCGWVGLAELPGKQTWYTADEYGVFSKGTVLQETLHNYGIWHGWKDGAEYEDYSTAMGRGDSCPSAPELWRLGWVTLLAQLNSSSFPDKVLRSYTVPATYLGPEKVVIKIQPDWLPRYSRNMYLGLRVKAEGDVDLLQEFNRKINVHELESVIDNNFFARGDPVVTIIDTIDENASVNFPSYNLFVVAEGLIESGTKMVIKVCRYQKDMKECRGGSNSPPPLLEALKKPPPRRAPPPLKKPPLPLKKSPPPSPLPPPFKRPPPPSPPPSRRLPPPLRRPPPPLRRPPPPQPPYMKRSPPSPRRAPPPSPPKRPPPRRASPPPDIPPATSFTEPPFWFSPDDQNFSPPYTWSPPEDGQNGRPPTGGSQTPPEDGQNGRPPTGGSQTPPEDGQNWRPPTGGNQTPPEDDSSWHIPPGNDNDDGRPPIDWYGGGGGPVQMPPAGDSVWWQDWQ